MAALAFLRPFERSSAIAFGADIRGISLALTLPTPIPSVQVQAIPPPLVRIELALSLAQPILSVRASRVHLATAAPSLTPTLSLTASYDNNVWRGVFGATAAAQSGADARSVRSASPWVDSVARYPAAREQWRDAAHRAGILHAPHLQSARIDARRSAVFAGAAAAPDALSQAAWALLLPSRADAGISAQDAAALQACSLSPFSIVTPYDQPRAPIAWGMRAAVALGTALDRFDSAALHRDRIGQRLPWRWGRALSGISRPAPTPPEPPGPSFNNDLNFVYLFLRTADIEFARRVSRRIPLRRTYFVLHEIAITRVSDGAELHFADLTLSADVGSWGWSLSGNALGDATYARLVASPFTEINVRINGIDWRFLITSVSQSRSFGSTGYRVSGVSPALALTAPLSDARSRSVTAPWTLNQLADQEVADTAWTVDWAAPDWLIPGGVWQYSQQTPLQAIGSLAEAAGGFVQAERVNRVIQIAPRYPAWPWSTDWLFQSASWPVSILRDLTRSPKPGNNYNAVYAAGTVSGGIMGYVRRAGSAGDIQPGAPITNTLITHVDGARAFGGSYLADHLDQTDVTFSTILGGDAPLVALASRIDLTEPGQLPLRVLTQAVSVAARRGSNAVTVTQSVKGVSFDG